MLKLFILLVAPCATDICLENHSKALFAIEGKDDCEAVALIFTKNEVGRTYYYCAPADK